MNRSGTNLIINDKKLYIFNEHHHVLEAWAKFRLLNEVAPILITLDHHTDTMPAFRMHTKFDEKKTDYLISKINVNSMETIHEAINKLQNDEHIDAALKSDIIAKAFVISFDGTNNDPPSKEEEQYQNQLMYNIMFGKDCQLVKPTRPYTYPESKLYIIEKGCFIGCDKRQHDDECERELYKQIIESNNLNNKLDIINEMNPGIVKDNEIVSEYILDIDLDFFHTMDSIQPKDTETFYRLIRKAKIITIAMEPDYVSRWKVDDHSISSEKLLEHLLIHIKRATT